MNLFWDLLDSWNTYPNSQVFNPAAFHAFLVVSTTWLLTTSLADDSLHLAWCYSIYCVYMTLQHACCILALWGFLWTYLLHYLLKISTGILQYLPLSIPIFNVMCSTTTAMLLSMLASIGYLTFSLSDIIMFFTSNASYTPITVAFIFSLVVNKLSFFWVELLNITGTPFRCTTLPVMLLLVPGHFA